MRGKLFLFGTGKISKRYTELFKQISVEIVGYIDNDREKWGTYFYGKKVDGPQKLLQEKDPDIFIACSAQDEISIQLSEMNLEKCIVSMNQIIDISDKSVIDNIMLKNLMLDRCREKSIIIDNLNGKWGGAEDWSHIMVSALAERGYDVYVVEHTKQPPAEGLEKNTLYITMDEENEYCIYSELIKLLMIRRPFILFNVKNSELLWAAVTIKQRYPKESFIVSSILNDAIYDKFCEWDDHIDLYLCISSRIQENLVHLYHVDRRKVHCRTPFIEKIRIINKIYSIENDKPLKVGYPCRLIAYQKRADMIPKLIMYLEQNNVNYVLNIAGDGPCEIRINEFVESNQLHSKVKMYGRLSRTELYDFLDEQDVYLNISEFEGTSLTMLEAMASGCVPVVTNVSGVSDFIENRINGFTVNVGDLEKISEHIAFLDHNRYMLAKYGGKSMQIVQEKCRLSEYIDDIEEIIKFV